MYGDVVLGLGHAPFEAALAAVKAGAGKALDIELDAGDLRKVVARFKEVYVSAGAELPADPREQLKAAIAAVFRSWNAPRAVKYRELNRIRGLHGTAVNVQAMVRAPSFPSSRPRSTHRNITAFVSPPPTPAPQVYGNLNDNSGSGVCFTRNPATGEGGRLFGEILPNAQGEDVVSGARTPLPVAEMAARFPAAHAELARSTAVLEREMRDMQDWCGVFFVNSASFRSGALALRAPRSRALPPRPPRPPRRPGAAASSRSRTALCSCCRRGTASARAPRRCASRPRWPMRARSRARRPS